MKQHYVPAPAGSFSLALELNRRMQESQRHRLLHGYPLTSSMSIRKYERQERGMQFESPSIKSLLVGVLPHPFCNPAVRGCGFCTFPHQPYSLKKAEAVVGSVIM
jgi:hypothetical protein